MPAARSNGDAADPFANLDLAGALLEATPSLVCLLDREGKIVRLNGTWEVVTGIPGEELVGRDAQTVLIPPEDAEAFSSLLADAWRKPRSGYYEGRLPIRAGGQRRIAWTTRPVLDEHGHARLLACVGEDITDRDPDAAEPARLVEEHGALRRAATLVARGIDPERLCQLVTEEAGRLVRAPSAAMLRFDDQDRGTIVGRWAVVDPGGFPIGATLGLDGDTAVTEVRRTGRPARVDDYTGRRGEIAGAMRQIGFNSAVAAPIAFSGDPWGVIVAATTGEEPLASDTERRLAGFAELVGLALASAHARQELTASRARIVEAGDAERRRLERNLHDGTQQRLVSLALMLKVADTKVDDDPTNAHHALARAADELEQALEELRELARGLHPAVLSEWGLRPALQALADRAGFPVTIAAVPRRPLSKSTEVAAYYVASEALANVAKHAAGSHARIHVQRVGGHASVEISDDGPGGADPTEGSGLRGLADRVQALGGELEVYSPPGEGTWVRATLPIDRTA